MEYIRAEEFLKQPKTIQAVFIEWWKCELGDLFVFDGVDDRDMNIVQVIGSENQSTITKANKGGSRIPLFAEGQLRKFIEDKTNDRFIELEYFYDTGYDLRLIGAFEDIDIEHENLGHDILEAYWKVALEIAKEKVKA